MTDNIKWDDDIKWDTPSQSKSLFQKADTPLISEETAKRPGLFGEALRGSGRTLPSTTLKFGPFISSLVPPLLREKMAPKEISEQTSPLAIASYGLPFLGKKIISAIAQRKPNLEQSAISLYRKALKPSYSDIQRTEVIGKGIVRNNIDEALKIAAEEQLPLKVVEGKLNTEIAQNNIKNRLSLLDETLTKQLSTPDKAKSFVDLRQVGNEAKRLARQTTKNDTIFKSISQDIDEYINDAIKVNARYVSGAKLNQIKQGMYEVGYNQMKPTADKSARFIGRSAKNKIEKLYPTEDIKGINSIMGKYATLQNLLRNAHGRSVSPTAMTKMVARITGATLGSAVPVVGNVGGYFLGGEAAKLLSSPVRLASKASQQAKKAGIIQRSFKSVLRKP